MRYQIHEKHSLNHDTEFMFQVQDKRNDSSFPKMYGYDKSYKNSIIAANKKSNQKNALACQKKKVTHFCFNSHLIHKEAAQALTLKNTQIRH